MVADEGLRELRAVPLPGISRHSGRVLGDLLAAQRQAARDADWPALLGTSLTLLGAGQGHAVAVRAVRSSDGTLAEDALTGVGEVLDGLRQLAARPDHEAQAEGIRALLQESDAGLAARAAPLLDQVAAGAVDPSAFEEGERLADLLGQAPGTDVEAGLCVAAVTRGLLGVVHGTLNTTRPTDPDPAGAERRLATLRSIVDRVDGALTTAERSLFDACAGGERDEIAAAAVALARRAQDLLVHFAAAQAEGAALARTLRSAGRNADAERVGRALARGGRLVRRAVADAAVGTRLDLDLALRVLPPAVADLTDTAGLAFAAALPDGRNTEIAHLGPDDDGDLVEVAGFVTAASAAREPDGKLVGRVTLLDPSSGSSVELSLLFVHPAHAGLTLDGYAVAHGRYRSASERLDGGPGVEVDVLAPTALSRESWQARLWFSATPWLHPWRGRLHLDWSLGTHSAGPDDFEDATRGAAELILTPFTRTENL
ncbi:hypothetical protein [Nocardioides donggukensis]|uniref:Uncharacterized protein n=1 Tax=Nocardioides donggukensis TaxID=2774019 RepID=A0A927K5N9_9ACTN|nr:hypothetical protein [Nocardioides donggukensis]MBD8868180.1 hypothetical protein [Nocardioides donggukensis]